MNKFIIVFMDNKKFTVEAFNFATAKVIAAHDRVMDGAVTYRQLTVNEKMSSRKEY